MEERSTPGFVAINTIACEDGYRSRFEELFRNRAHAIDALPGFRKMQVLRPTDPGGSYLVISHWESEASFRAWTGSEAFLAGHRRAFEDIRLAKERSEDSPMRSEFRTYVLLCE